MEMNLKEYLRYTKKEEDLQKLFYNMSKTMKYKQMKLILVTTFPPPKKAQELIFSFNFIEYLNKRESFILPTQKKFLQFFNDII